MKASWCPRLRARVARAIVFSGAAFCAVSCQSYRAQPLDLAAHNRVFLARTVDPSDLSQFAQTLATGAQGDSFFVADDAISAYEAEAIAMVFNAQLRSARAAAAVMRATSENSGLWQDPSVGVDLTRLLDGSNDAWEAFGNISLTIPLWGRLEVEQSRDALAFAAQIARVHADEWRVRFELRRAWSEWAALELEVAIMRGFIENLERIMVVVEAMETRGEMARVEARLFPMERALARQRLTESEGAQQRARLVIHRLMGLPPEAQFRAAPGRIDDYTAFLMHSEYALRDGADIVKFHPSLVVMDADYLLAERSLELEIRKQYPDLVIGPGFGTQDGQRQFVLGLGVTLPFLNANRQAIAEAFAARDLARIRAEAALETLLDQLAVAHSELSSARASRAIVELEVIPLIEAQDADLRRLAQQGGEVDALLLLGSLQRQQEAKLNLINSTRLEAFASLHVLEVIDSPSVPTSATIPPEIQP